MKLIGSVTVDGKEHKIDAGAVALRVEVSDETRTARGENLMGMQIKVTIAISGDTVTTTVTTISSDGKTTTTEERTSTPTSTTTTTTTTTEK
jgi:hypothetical protein